MFEQLRDRIKGALPPSVVHAYRVARHTTIWPCEQEMVKAREFLDPDKVAIDVGANVGLFTTVLARRSKKVIAFEPNPSCAAHLAAVASRNCEVVAKAVSDESGTTLLRVPTQRGIPLHALGTIEAANLHTTEKRATSFITYPVETITLDALLPALSAEHLGFINIDAEGHEFGVLRGGERLLAVHRPVLLVELEYRHGAPVAEVFAWLRDHGYVAQALNDRQTLGPIDADSLRLFQDEERLQRSLAGCRQAGYVNNIFFLPSH